MASEEHTSESLPIQQAREAEIIGSTGPGNEFHTREVRKVEAGQGPDFVTHGDIQEPEIVVQGNDATLGTAAFLEAPCPKKVAFEDIHKASEDALHEKIQDQGQFGEEISIVHEIVDLRSSIEASELLRDEKNAELMELAQEVNEVNADAALETVICDQEESREMITQVGNSKVHPYVTSQSEIGGIIEDRMERRLREAEEIPLPSQTGDFALLAGQDMIEKETIPDAEETDKDRMLNLGQTRTALEEVGSEHEESHPWSDSESTEEIKDVISDNQNKVETKSESTKKVESIILNKELDASENVLVTQNEHAINKNFDKEEASLILGEASHPSSEVTLQTKLESSEMSGEKNQISQEYWFENDQAVCAENLDDQGEPSSDECLHTKDAEMTLLVESSEAINVKCIAEEQQGVTDEAEARDYDKPSNEFSEYIEQDDFVKQGQNVILVEETQEGQTEEEKDFTEKESLLTETELRGMSRSTCISVQDKYANELHTAPPLIDQIGEHKVKRKEQDPRNEEVEVSELVSETNNEYNETEQENILETNVSEESIESEMGNITPISRYDYMDGTEKQMAIRDTDTSATKELNVTPKDGTQQMKFTEEKDEYIGTESPIHDNEQKDAHGQMNSDLSGVKDETSDNGDNENSAEEMQIDTGEEFTENNKFKGPLADCLPEKVAEGYQDDEKEDMMLSQEAAKAEQEDISVSSLAVKHETSGEGEYFDLSRVEDEATSIGNNENTAVDPNKKMTKDNTDDGLEVYELREKKFDNLAALRQEVEIEDEYFSNNSLDVKDETGAVAENELLTRLKGELGENEDNKSLTDIQEVNNISEGTISPDNAREEQNIQMEDVPQESVAEKIISQSENTVENVMQMKHTSDLFIETSGTSPESPAKELVEEFSDEREAKQFPEEIVENLSIVSKELETEKSEQSINPSNEKTAAEGEDEELAEQPAFENVAKESAFEVKSENFQDDNTKQKISKPEDVSPELMEENTHPQNNTEENQVRTEDTNKQFTEDENVEGCSPEHSGSEGHTQDAKETKEFHEEKYENRCIESLEIEKEKECQIQDFSKDETRPGGYNETLKVQEHLKDENPIEESPKASTVSENADEEKVKSEDSSNFTENPTEERVESNVNDLKLVEELPEEMSAKGDTEKFTAETSPKDGKIIEEASHVEGNIISKHNETDKETMQVDDTSEQSPEQSNLVDTPPESLAKETAEAFNGDGHEAKEGTSEQYEEENNLDTPSESLETKKAETCTDEGGTEKDFTEDVKTSAGENFPVEHADDEREPKDLSHDSSISNHATISMEDNEAVEEEHKLLDEQITGEASLSAGNIIQHDDIIDAVNIQNEDAPEKSIEESTIPQDDKNEEQNAQIEDNKEELRKDEHATNISPGYSTLEILQRTANDGNEKKEYNEKKCETFLTESTETESNNEVTKLDSSIPDNESANKNAEKLTADEDVQDEIIIYKAPSAITAGVIQDDTAPSKGGEYLANSVPPDDEGIDQKALAKDKTQQATGTGKQIDKLAEHDQMQKEETPEQSDEISATGDDEKLRVEASPNDGKIIEETSPVAEIVISQNEIKEEMQMEGTNEQNPAESNLVDTPSEPQEEKTTETSTDDGHEAKESIEEVTTTAGERFSIEHEEVVRELTELDHDPSISNHATITTDDNEGEIVEQKLEDQQTPREASISAGTAIHQDDSSDAVKIQKEAAPEKSIAETATLQNDKNEEPNAQIEEKSEELIIDEATSITPEYPIEEALQRTTNDGEEENEDSEQKCASSLLGSTELEEPRDGASLKSPVPNYKTANEYVELTEAENVKDETTEEYNTGISVESPDEKIVNISADNGEKESELNEEISANGDDQKLTAEASPEYEKKIAEASLAKEMVETSTETGHESTEGPSEQYKEENYHLDTPSESLEAKISETSTDDGHEANDITEEVTTSTKRDENQINQSVEHTAVGADHEDLGFQTSDPENATSTKRENEELKEKSLDHENIIEDTSPSSGYSIPCDDQKLLAEASPEDEKKIVEASPEDEKRIAEASLAKETAETSTEHGHDSTDGTSEQQSLENYHVNTPSESLETKETETSIDDGREAKEIREEVTTEASPEDENQIAEASLAKDTDAKESTESTSDASPDDEKKIEEASFAKEKAETSTENDHKSTEGTSEQYKEENYHVDTPSESLEAKTIETSTNDEHEAKDITEEVTTMSKGISKEDEVVKEPEDLDHDSLASRSAAIIMEDDEGVIVEQKQRDEQAMGEASLSAGNTIRRDNNIDVVKIQKEDAPEKSMKESTTLQNDKNEEQNAQIEDKMEELTINEYAPSISPEYPIEQRSTNDKEEEKEDSEQKLESFLTESTEIDTSNENVKKFIAENVRDENIIDEASSAITTEVDQNDVAICKGEEFLAASRSPDDEGIDQKALPNDETEQAKDTGKEIHELVDLDKSEKLNDEMQKETSEQSVKMTEEYRMETTHEELTREYNKGTSTESPDEKIVADADNVKKDTDLNEESDENQINQSVEHTAVGADHEDLGFQTSDPENATSTKGENEELTENSPDQENIIEDTSPSAGYSIPCDDQTLLAETSPEDEKKIAEASPEDEKRIVEASLAKETAKTSTENGHESIDGSSEQHSVENYHVDTPSESLEAKETETSTDDGHEAKKIGEEVTTEASPEDEKEIAEATLAKETAAQESTESTSEALPDDEKKIEEASLAEETAETSTENDHESTEGTSEQYKIENYHDVDTPSESLEAKTIETSTDDGHEAKDITEEVTTMGNSISIDDVVQEPEDLDHDSLASRSATINMEDNEGVIVEQKQRDEQAMGEASLSAGNTIRHDNNIDVVKIQKEDAPEKSIEESTTLQNDKNEEHNAQIEDKREELTINEYATSISPEYPIEEVLQRTTNDKEEEKEDSEQKPESFLTESTETETSSENVKKFIAENARDESIFDEASSAIIAEVDQNDVALCKGEEFLAASLSPNDEGIDQKALPNDETEQAKDTGKEIHELVDLDKREKLNDEMQKETSEQSVKMTEEYRMETTHEELTREYNTGTSIESSDEKIVADADNVKKETDLIEESDENQVNQSVEHTAVGRDHEDLGFQTSDPENATSTKGENEELTENSPDQENIIEDTSPSAGYSIPCDDQKLLAEASPEDEKKIAEASLVKEMAETSTEKGHELTDGTSEQHNVDNYHVDTPSESLEVKETETFTDDGHESKEIREEVTAEASPEDEKEIAEASLAKETLKTSAENEHESMEGTSEASPEDENQIAEASLAKETAETSTENDHESTEGTSEQYKEENYHVDAPSESLEAKKNETSTDDGHEANDITEEVIKLGKSFSIEGAEVVKEPEDLGHYSSTSRTEDAPEKSMEGSATLQNDQNEEQNVQTVDKGEELTFNEHATNMSSEYPIEEVLQRTTNDGEEEKEDSEQKLESFLTESAEIEKNAKGAKLESSIPINETSNENVKKFSTDTVENVRDENKIDEASSAITADLNQEEAALVDEGIDQKVLPSDKTEQATDTGKDTDILADLDKSEKHMDKMQKETSEHSEEMTEEYGMETTHEDLTREYNTGTSTESPNEKIIVDGDNIKKEITLSEESDDNQSVEHTAVGADHEDLGFQTSELEKVTSTKGENEELTEKSPDKEKIIEDISLSAGNSVPRDDKIEERKVKIEDVKHESAEGNTVSQHDDTEQNYMEKDHISQQIEGNHAPVTSAEVPVEISNESSTADENKTNESITEECENLSTQENNETLTAQNNAQEEITQVSSAITAEQMPDNASIYNTEQFLSTDSSKEGKGIEQTSEHNMAEDKSEQTADVLSKTSQTATANQIEEQNDQIQREEITEQLIEETDIVTINDQPRESAEIEVSEENFGKAIADERNTEQNKEIGSNPETEGSEKETVLEKTAAHVEGSSTASDVDCIFEEHEESLSLGQNVDSGIQVSGKYTTEKAVDEGHDVPDEVLDAREKNYNNDEVAKEPLKEVEGGMSEANETVNEGLVADAFQKSDTEMQIESEGQVEADFTEKFREDDQVNIHSQVTAVSRFSGPEEVQITEKGNSRALEGDGTMIHESRQDNLEDEENQDDFARVQESAPQTETVTVISEKDGSVTKFNGRIQEVENSASAEMEEQKQQYEASNPKTGNLLGEENHNSDSLIERHERETTIGTEKENEKLIDHPSDSTKEDTAEKRAQNDEVTIKEEAESSLEVEVPINKAENENKVTEESALMEEVLLEPEGNDGVKFSIQTSENQSDAIDLQQDEMKTVVISPELGQDEEENAVYFDSTTETQSSNVTETPCNEPEASPRVETLDERSHLDERGEHPDNTTIRENELSEERIKENLESYDLVKKTEHDTTSGNEETNANLTEHPFDSSIKDATEERQQNDTVIQTDERETTIADQVPVEHDDEMKERSIHKTAENQNDTTYLQLEEIKTVTSTESSQNGEQKMIDLNSITEADSSEPSTVEETENECHFPEERCQSSDNSTKKEDELSEERTIKENLRSDTVVKKHENEIAAAAASGTNEKSSSYPFDLTKEDIIEERLRNNDTAPTEEVGSNLDTDSTVNREASRNAVTENLIITDQVLTGPANVDNMRSIQQVADNQIDDSHLEHDETKQKAIDSTNITGNESSDITETPYKQLEALDVAETAEECGLEEERGQSLQNTTEGNNEPSEKIINEVSMEPDDETKVLSIQEAADNQNDAYELLHKEIKTGISTESVMNGKEMATDLNNIPETESFDKMETPYNNSDASIIVRTSEECGVPEEIGQSPENYSKREQQQSQINKEEVVMEPEDEDEVKVIQELLERRNDITDLQHDEMQAVTRSESVQNENAMNFEKTTETENLDKMDTFYNESETSNVVNTLEECDLSEERNKVETVEAERSLKQTHWEEEIKCVKTSSGQKSEQTVDNFDIVGNEEGGRTDLNDIQATDSHLPVTCERKGNDDVEVELPAEGIAKQIKVVPTEAHRVMEEETTCESPSHNNWKHFEEIIKNEMEADEPPPPNEEDEPLQGVSVEEEHSASTEVTGKTEPDLKSMPNETEEQQFSDLVLYEQKHKGSLLTEEIVEGNIERVQPLEEKNTGYSALEQVRDENLHEEVPREPDVQNLDFDTSKGLHQKEELAQEASKTAPEIIMQPRDFSSEIQYTDGEKTTETDTFIHSYLQETKDVEKVQATGISDRKLEKLYKETTDVDSQLTGSLEQIHEPYDELNISEETTNTYERHKAKNSDITIEELSTDEDSKLCNVIVHEVPYDQIGKESEVIAKTNQVEEDKGDAKKYQVAREYTQEERGIDDVLLQTEKNLMETLDRKSSTREHKGGDNLQVVSTEDLSASQQTEKAQEVNISEETTSTYEKHKAKNSDITIEALSTEEGSKICNVIINDVPYDQIGKGSEVIAKTNQVEEDKGDTKKDHQLAREYTQEERGIDDVLLRSEKNFKETLERESSTREHKAEDYWQVVSAEDVTASQQTEEAQEVLIEGLAHHGEIEEKQDQMQAYSIKIEETGKTEIKEEDVIRRAIPEEKEEELGELGSEEVGLNAATITEGSKEMDVKAPHKKSHNLLSGVGSRVKQSISKVKKAITGKPSQPKNSSPKKATAKGE